MNTRLIAPPMLFLTVIFSMIAGIAAAQILTINNGSVVTVANGSALDVNCYPILVREGGTFLLDSGTLINKNVVTVEAGGIFTNTDGIISNTCKSFYFIFPQGGNPIIVPLPKSSP